MTPAKDDMNYIYNTKEKGIFYFLIFKEKDKDFAAVCLNLDIVEYGNNPEILLESIKEAAFSHLGAVRKNKLSDDNLNKVAPQKYWDVFISEAGFLEELKTKPSVAKRISASKPDSFTYTKQPYSFNYA